jgi:hypothetical protein
VAEHFQPVGMRLAGHEFGGTPADPLGSLTPQEAMVVEEELEQGQVVRPQMAAEKKVAAVNAGEKVWRGTVENRGARDERRLYCNSGVKRKEQCPLP